MSPRVTDPVSPRPAASVVLLRAGVDGPEILFLRRNPALAFHGGAWVFPGGRIDAGDRDAADPDEEPAARRAAVRETREEAGLDVAVGDLTYLAHWTTPRERPIRYATWFFLAEAPMGAVTVDGDEIHAFRWVRPAEALRRQAAGGMVLAAPTFVLTARLAEFDTIAAARSAVAGWPRERLLGRLRDVPGGHVVLYAQDAAYDSDRLEDTGRRHRLWMVDDGWRYERR